MTRVENGGGTSKEREVNGEEPRGFGRYWATFPVFLTVICLNAIGQGVIVNGFISTSISSIEKRFSLTSTMSGIFSATYDVAVAIVLIPLAVYARRVNKPFTIGLGMVLVGLGSLCLVIPQYTEGNYSVGGERSEHCDLTRGDQCTQQPVSVLAFPILLASQVLVGIGAGPLFTYGYSTLDEFDSHKRTGRNMAVFMGVSTLGPALGFIGGGLLLDVWGDIGKTDPSDLGISGPKDPRWYGAWWLGFFFAGILCICTAFGMLFFPRKLYDTDERKKGDVAITHRHLEVDYSGHKWEYLMTFKLFFFNPTCMSLIAMQTFESLVMNGYITFIPKLLENLFGYTSSWASIITGLIVVPMGIVGNVIGAQLTKKTNTSFRAMMKWLMLLNVMTITCSSILFLRCEDRSIAGLNREFSNSTHNSLCSYSCNCDRIFNPVCDESSGVSYYSSCHAGCGPSNEAFPSLWNQCSCPDSRSVVKGWCKMDCRVVEYIFFAVFSLMAATIFAGGPILQNAALRVVSFHHRDQFICFGWMFMRIFGSIPGAVIFGILIDKTCLHWMNDCGTSEKCVLYDTSKLALYVFLFTLITKLAVLVSQFISWKSYIPISGALSQSEETENRAGEMATRVIDSQTSLNNNAEATATEEDL